MAEHLFAIDTVGYAYGDQQALAEICLNLTPGRFYSIVGPNGCGKTTLLEMLGGGRRPDQGSVLFKGREVSAIARRELARSLALVPQDYVINFAFTVHEVVLMGRHPHMPRFGNPSARDLRDADRAMEEIGVSHLRNRYVNELSGGEKQRVAVARALAQQAGVLLLDEATSNLDIRYTLTILHALRQRVLAQDMTVIAVMHNLDLASAFSDEIIFMNNGRIAHHGPLAETLTPENIKEVFGVSAAVTHDEFSGALRVSHRLEEQ